MLSLEHQVREVTLGQNLGQIVSVLYDPGKYNDFVAHYRYDFHLIKTENKTSALFTICLVNEFSKMSTRNFPFWASYVYKHALRKVQFHLVPSTDT